MFLDVLPAVPDTSRCFSVALDGFHSDSYSAFCFDSFDTDELRGMELAVDEDVVSGMYRRIYCVLTVRSQTCLTLQTKISITEEEFPHRKLWTGNRSQETAVRVSLCCPLLHLSAWMEMSINILGFVFSIGYMLDHVLITTLL